MLACSRHKRCTYWQYKKATKDCRLMSVCGYVTNNWTGAATWYSPRRNPGWTMGAKKCQNTRDTESDFGIIHYNDIDLNGFQFSPLCQSYITDAFCSINQVCAKTFKWLFQPILTGLKRVVSTPIPNQGNPDCLDGVQKMQVRPKVSINDNFSLSALYNCRQHLFHAWNNLVSTDSTSRTRPRHALPCDKHYKSRGVSEQVWTAGALLLFHLPPRRSLLFAKEHMENHRNLHLHVWLQSRAIRVWIQTL